MHLLVYELYGYQNVRYNDKKPDDFVDSVDTTFICS